MWQRYLTKYMTVHHPSYTLYVYIVQIVVFTGILYLIYFLYTYVWPIILYLYLTNYSFAERAPSEHWLLSAPGNLLEPPCSSNRCKQIHHSDGLLKSCFVICWNFFNSSPFILTQWFPVLKSPSFAQIPLEGTAPRTLVAVVKVEVNRSSKAVVVFIIIVLCFRGFRVGRYREIYVYCVD